MTNREMDAIQVDNPVMSEKRTLSPDLKLFRQGLIQATDRAGTRRYSYQFFRDFANFMGRSETSEHLRQGFGYLRLVAVVALENLGMKLPFSVSGNLEIFNAPCGSHQVAGVGPIAIATTSGSTFSPRCSDALLQF